MPLIMREMMMLMNNYRMISLQNLYLDKINQQIIKRVGQLNSLKILKRKN
jgi:hypothetical protein